MAELNDGDLENRDGPSPTAKPRRLRLIGGLEAENGLMGLVMRPLQS